MGGVCLGGVGLCCVGRCGVGLDDVDPGAGALDAGLAGAEPYVVTGGVAPYVGPKAGVLEVWFATSFGVEL